MTDTITIIIALLTIYSAISSVLIMALHERIRKLEEPFNIEEHLKEMRDA